MVYKLPTKRKWTLWHNKPQCQILRNPNQHVITAKNQAATETSFINSRKRETKITTKILVILTVVKQTLTPITKRRVMALPIVQTTEKTKNQELSNHPVAKQTTLKRNAILEPMQQLDHLLGMEDQWNRVKLNNETHRSQQLKMSRLRPKF